MNTELTLKRIKERCGSVSFKKGEAFFRADKVRFETYHRDGYEAVVKGKDDFYVTVDRDEGGRYHAKCSCPTLASVTSDCQHIAAVLLAIYEHQRKGTTPFPETEADLSLGEGLSEELMTLFRPQPTRSSGHQSHFENRQVLDVEIICKPVAVENEQYIMGIKMMLQSIPVLQIQNFLEEVKQGRPSVLSSLFTYDPHHHCFQPDADTIIRQLFQVSLDEKMYLDGLSETGDDGEILLISPSSWDRLLPYLIKAPFVKLEDGENHIDVLTLSQEPLPIQFFFTEREGRGYQLKIRGLNRVVVLPSYQMVLSAGKITRLHQDDCKRLLDIKQMLKNTGTNYIPIAYDQLDFFLEKVVPGLKKLGNVEISQTITEQLMKPPLKAKLYLDRVKNRLLAGLEFHYEHIVINPLEMNEHSVGIPLIRDTDKESAILKLMEDSQFAKTEGGYFLHNEELEYEFLHHVVPKLEKLVQIYTTTSVRNRIFRGNVHPKINVRLKKERTDWLEFKFDIDGIPEKQIRDVLQALEEKRKYYRLKDGTLFSLETQEFAEIQRFLREVPLQDEDLESGLNVPIVRGLRLLDSVDEGETFTFEESFLQFVQSLRNPASLSYEVPEAVAPILRDYQKHGYQWMKALANYGFGGILADDMGLGKTLQSITFILSELSIIREKKQPALIVCPSSLLYNWLSEWMKFAPDVQVVVIDGKKEDRLQLQKESVDIDVIITSYPLLRRDLKWYEKQTFHTVFFDEAQAFKNPITQTARAVKRIQAVHRFALTGTPIENSLEELWSIFHVVFPELFLGLKEFSHLTRVAIAKRSRPFLLRRLKEDVLSELPEKIEMIDAVELLPEQKKLYAAYLAKLKHDTFKHLDKDTVRKNRIRILAGLTRLRQICCHPALFVDGYKGSSAKFEQLLRMIREAQASGRRVLIFSQFTKMLNLIGREMALQGLDFFYLDGQTAPEERLEMTNQFNAGRRDFFLISLKAGGTGLNLTGADTVILYDLWWNPAVEEQAADRAHRMGQTNNVHVIKLVARGTIEEKMNELQEKKRELIEGIIDSKEVLTALTDEDILELLKES